MSKKADLAIVPRFWYTIANRQRQTWPTMVAKGEGWEDLYAAAKGELPVRATVDGAIEWVNELISRIDAAR